MDTNVDIAIERAVVSAGIAVDFEIKLVAPKPKIAPALWVEPLGKRIDVPLSSQDGKIWHGGVVAAEGTDLRAFCVAHVGKGGSMTIVIRESGFIWGPREFEPVVDVCSVGPINYEVG